MKKFYWTNHNIINFVNWFLDLHKLPERFKLENQSLKDTASQDWFLYGGLLALIGVILGFILPKLGWRRKNSWDSF